MIDEKPLNREEIIDNFIGELLEGGDQSTLDEYCSRYPVMRSAFERKYEVVKTLEEGFREDGLSGTEIDDYLIVEEIGRGGMGVVYLALQRSLDRYVALKVLPSNLAPGTREIRRFRAEARAVARLSHPNIVPVFSIGEEKGMYYIAMALIPGLSLNKVIEGLKAGRDDPATASIVGDIIDRHPDFPRIGLKDAATGEPASIVAGRDPSFRDRPYLLFVLSLCSEIADALGYAHRNGVCHGDLKPSNIMLSSGGVPMIVDFGLAKDLRSVASVQSQDFLGTLAYASPEHLAHNAVNEKSDIWSFGVTMYEMITLQQPFRTHDVAGTVDRIARSDPPPMRARSRRISKDVEAVVNKCLEKDPGKRYDAAQELKEDIDRILAGRPVKARPVGRIGRQVRRARRNPLVSLLGAALVVFALITVYVAYNAAIRKSVSVGTRYYDEGQYSEALRSYGAALSRLKWIPFTEKSRAEVLCDLGNAWSGKGEYGEAIRSYERALEIDPGLVSALMGLGDVYLEIGAYDKTVSYYDKVLVLSPNDRNSYYQRGKAFKEQGMYDKALKDFHAAITIAAGDVDTLKEISAILREKGLSTMGDRSAYLRASGFTPPQIRTILPKANHDR